MINLSFLQGRFDGLRFEAFQHPKDHAVAVLYPPMKGSQVLVSEINDSFCLVYKGASDRSPIRALGESEILKAVECKLAQPLEVEDYDYTFLSDLTLDFIGTPIKNSTVTALIRPRNGRQTVFIKQVKDFFAVYAMSTLYYQERSREAARERVLALIEHGPMIPTDDLASLLAPYTDRCHLRVEKTDRGIPYAILTLTGHTDSTPIGEGQIGIDVEGSEDWREYTVYSKHFHWHVKDELELHETLRSILDGEDRYLNLYHKDRLLCSSVIDSGKLGKAFGERCYALATKALIQSHFATTLSAYSLPLDEIRITQHTFYGNETWDLPLSDLPDEEGVPAMLGSVRSAIAPFCAAHGISMEWGKRDARFPCPNENALLLLGTEPHQQMAIQALKETRIALFKSTSGRSLDLTPDCAELLDMLKGIVEEGRITCSAECALRVDAEGKEIPEECLGTLRTLTKESGRLDLQVLYRDLDGNEAFAMLWSWERAECLRLIPENGSYRAIPFPEILNRILFALNNKYVYAYPTSTAVYDSAFTADHPAIHGFNPERKTKYLLYFEGEERDEQEREDFYPLTLTYERPDEGGDGVIHDHSHPFNLPTALDRILDLVGKR